ncbi:uncharacterized protein FOMMEDRAFT_25013 [Fomitiporia mediterranea MF3/22]|uniref:uncharacterized protein n=1 Tax=Fomitiporia mediterranea (strain MF3/22) TaxID=694068 RepID=UPI00044082D0|nr:uncharacterized protein FOMMEDRAFT_25013 [Fomitiporia mediterranea MF3/22]EJD07717.1 hypothetical protein FOMMEDRAFT_25013 [Fomitiporia mediterranea MF3/22]
MGSEKEDNTEPYRIEESSSDQNLDDLQRLLDEMVRRTEDPALMGHGSSVKEACADLYRNVKGSNPAENTAYVEELRNYVMAGSDKFRPGSMIQAYSTRHSNEYTTCILEYVISGEGDDQISAYRNILNVINKLVNDIPFGRMFKPVCTREDFTQDIL